MAVFGLPGGMEWLMIMVIVTLLFVPGLVVFWLGYLTGRNAGAPQATVEPTATPTAAPAAPVEDENA